MKHFLYYFQIKLLLTADQRKRFDFFILLTLISMCLEVLGISLIVPIIKLLSGSSIKIKYIENFSLLQTTSLILSILILIITIKVVFLGYFNRLIYNFYSEIKISLSKKIYSIYNQLMLTNKFNKYY